MYSDVCHCVRLCVVVVCYAMDTTFLKSIQAATTTSDEIRSKIVREEAGMKKSFRELEENDYSGFAM